MSTISAPLPSPHSPLAKATRGIAFGAFTNDDGDGVNYRLTLLSVQDDEHRIAYETRDECEAVLVWRRCAQECLLPRYVEIQPEAFILVEDRLGALAVRARKARRRGSPLTKRRPRMSLRRQVATLERGPIVHQNEREIMARN